MHGIPTLNALRHPRRARRVWTHARMLCTAGLGLAGLILSSCSTGDATAPAPQIAEHSVTGPEAMRRTGAALIESLDEGQRELIMFALADTSARTNWSNLPDVLFDRGGLRTGDMSAEQRLQLHDLLRASSSSQGYLKLAGIMWLDDILREEALAQGDPGEGFRGRLIESWRTENYYVSIFGDPATDEDWAWLITGHHMAASFTVSGENVAFTPMFLGAEPYTIEGGPYAGWRILSHEVERGFALLQSLTAAQQSQAVLSEDVPRDILSGPGRKGSLAQLEGIQASALNAAQRQHLDYLIREYVRNADHAAAVAQLRKIEADGPDSLYFAWMGPTDDFDARYYYRVHGPSILIEYVREHGVGAHAPANHIHTIVRDPSNDYGEDWLGLHYQEHHER
ncbi:MAG: DUF3500 domain-containing protein [Bacteroidota bacterium]|nr:DUF3500 domain-containing protein [Bacteroidota bacterium]MDE2956713.1 DUF3500 domain-containing protein [Bacteroidota bacterium]